MIFPVEVDDDKRHDFDSNIHGAQRVSLIFAGPLLWSQLLALAIRLCTKGHVRVGEGSLRGRYGLGKV